MRGCLIQLAGFSRAGKDTVAGFLVEEFGLVQRCYAAKLKELARSLTVQYEIRERNIEIPYWGGEEWDKRHPCVQLGKNARDILYPTIWIDALLKDVSIREQIGSTGVVISDCRYMNEHEAGQRLAEELDVPYSLWWIENPTATPQGEEAEKTAPLCRMATIKIWNSPVGTTLDDLRGKTRTGYDYSVQGGLR